MKENIETVVSVRTNQAHTDIWVLDSQLILNTPHAIKETQVPRALYKSKPIGQTSLDCIIKITIHSSCEIEDFVETNLCKLRVILRSRVSRVVCSH